MIVQACSPEIVMEDNLQSGGEAEEPVKVAEEETDKGLEASREGLVELEEEEQQEEVIGRSSVRILDIALFRSG